MGSVDSHVSIVELFMPENTPGCASSDAIGPTGRNAVTATAMPAVVVNDTAMAYVVKRGDVITPPAIFHVKAVGVNVFCVAVGPEGVNVTTATVLVFIVSLISFKKPVKSIV